MKILASFVIPSKNNVHFLPRAVGSALAQTFAGVEVIVVNDGSTDMTKQYTDWLFKTESRVKVIATEGVGSSEARNIGNKAAQGKYIFVLDADDESMPERVAICLAKFHTSNASLLYGSAYVIDSEGHQTHLITAKPINRDEVIKRMYNEICHSTVAYSKEFAEKFPYRSGEISDLGLDDWEQQTRAMIAGEVFDFVPAHISAWRLTKVGISFRRDASKVLEFKTKYIHSLGVAA